MIFNTKIKTQSARSVIACMLFTATSILTFSSCQKEIETTSEFDGNLQISLKGIEEYQSENKNSKLASSNVNNNFSNAEIISYSGFDAITSLEILDPVNNKLNKEASIGSSLRKLADQAPSKLADSVYFRLVFFKTSDNSKVVDALIKANEAAPRIRLDIGTEYRWVAYSTNERTVPSFDASTNTIDKDSIANKDFLFASNTITIQPNDNFLNITLSRYTTLYEVNVDVRGTFGTIHDDTKVSIARTYTPAAGETNQEVQVNDLFQTADFNLLTGEYVGTPKSLNISGAQLKLITAGQHDKKTAKFYSIPNQITSTEKFGLKFEKLSLKMDDSSIRVFNNSIVKINHTPIVTQTSTRGRKFILNAMIVESGIQVGSSNTVWARSNLWYDVTNTTYGQYRFRVSPHQRDLINKKMTGSLFRLTDPNDLWKFGTSTPAGNPNENVDPCTKVYPENLWRTPSRSTFNLLNSKSDFAYVIDRGEPQFPGLLYLLFPVKYLEYVFRWTSSSQSDNAYKARYRADDPYSTSEDLFLSGVGYRQADGETNTEAPSYTALVSVGSESVNVLTVAGGLGGGGFYWARTANDSGSYADYFKVTYTKASLASLNLGIAALELINSNDIYSRTLPSFDKDYRMNIRCVRNQNYPDAPVYTD